MSNDNDIELGSVPEFLITFWSVIVSNKNSQTGPSGSKTKDEIQSQGQSFRTAQETLKHQHLKEVKWYKIKLITENSM